MRWVKNDLENYDATDDLKSNVRVAQVIKSGRRRGNWRGFLKFSNKINKQLKYLGKAVFNLYENFGIFKSFENCPEMFAKIWPNI